MFPTASTSGLQKTTPSKVVLPFYIYAALSFLLACGLLLWHTGIVGQHHFQPQTLAITHLMGLGWGTMMILGASHQLLPVLVEGQLSSERLARFSFILAALGIPLLVCAFYHFDLGWMLQAGALLVNLSVICYFLNVFSSIFESKKFDIFGLFMVTASFWLFVTVFIGLLLVFNFTRSLLPENSVEYLSLHAHLGIVGWFLLMVVGVASRLIPMFLISKYSRPATLWWVYLLINGGLLGFIYLRSRGLFPDLYYAPFLLVLIALILFARYCIQAYKTRIRKKVDSQMKVSLVSVALMFFPLTSLLGVIYFISIGGPELPRIIMLYGFCIFFGWVTAMILGMTFKTLPFIVWN
ncbi:MAG TPA: cytochrome C oxidase subunit I, partial [Sphingobacteriaceae bacterium]